MRRAWNALKRGAQATWNKTRVMATWSAKKFTRAKYTGTLNAETHKKILHLLEMRKARGPKAKYPGTMKQIRHKIIDYTLAVGKALAVEVKAGNTDLERFLGKSMFVKIDRNGNLVRTNVPRVIGLGRRRMRAKKIREEKHPQ